MTSTAGLSLLSGLLKRHLTSGPKSYLLSGLLKRPKGISGVLALDSIQANETLAVTLTGMSSILPLEIVEIILDLLAEDDEGHSALKTCSLVCQAFLPRCRKHIFGSIFLNGYTKIRNTVTWSIPLGSPTAHEFDRLLRETPEIADHIRELDYTFLKTDSTIPSIQESLKRITRLESLTLRNWESLKWFNWSSNPIRPAFLHLLHLPTLTRFHVTGFGRFLVSDLIPCVNLKYLEFGHKTSVAAEYTFPAILPDHPIRLNEFVARFRSGDGIMKLCTARRPDGQSIIDFRFLSKITVDIEVSDDIEASQELFRRFDFLTIVHITCK